MFCSNCGGALEEGAALCQHCGASVSTNTASEGTPAPNQNLEKAKDLSKNYISYLKDHLKAPIRHGFTVDSTQWINGLITLILFSVLSAFATYIATRPISRFWGGRVSALDTLILPLLYMAITLLIIIGVIFVVAKMAKSTASFQDVLARFGTLIIIPTLFVVLLFIFGILKINVLITLASFGSVVSFLTSVVLTSYSYSKDHTGGIDSYYAILLTFLGLAIALFLFGDNALGNLLF